MRLRLVLNKIDNTGAPTFEIDLVKNFIRLYSLVQVGIYIQRIWKKGPNDRHVTPATARKTNVIRKKWSRKHR